MSRRFSYSSRMAAIRPYVSFDFKHPNKLSRRNKVKITKHFNALARFGDEHSIINLKGRTPAQIDSIRRSLNAGYLTVPRSLKKTDFTVLFVRPIDADKQIRKIKGKWKLVTFKKVGKKKVRRIKETIRVEDDEIDEFSNSPGDWADRRFSKYPPDARFNVGNPQGWLMNQDGEGDDLVAAIDQVLRFYVKYDDPEGGNPYADWCTIEVSYNG